MIALFEFILKLRLIFLDIFFPPVISKTLISSHSYIHILTDTNLLQKIIPHSITNSKPSFSRMQTIYHKHQPSKTSSRRNLHQDSSASIMSQWLVLTHPPVIYILVYSSLEWFDLFCFVSNFCCSLSWLNLSLCLSEFLL